ncbi:MAG: hypothetical protein JSS09_09645, partial [Verrucomicrobia bacterium]|nr:hypothetical protein [Verrucomicrobiota bacterium]
TMVPPLSVDFTPKDNTTYCICCSSNAAVSRLPGEDDSHDSDHIMRSLPGRKGLKATPAPKPGYFSSDKKEAKENTKAREVFLEYLTQQVGPKVARMALPEDWEYYGAPLSRSEAQEITGKALEIYQKAFPIAQGLKCQSAYKLSQASPAAPPSPQRPNPAYFRLRLSSDPPLVVAKEDRRLKEPFNSRKVAKFVREISSADEDQANKIAREVEIVFKAINTGKPIDKNDIIASVVEKLREEKLPVNAPKPSRPELREYTKFEEIPTNVLKMLIEERREEAKE